MPIQRINQATPSQALSLGISRQGDTSALLGDTVSKALGQWKDKEILALEQRAQENVARQATLAQSELGTSGIAQPPDSLAQRYQAAYAAKSKEVFGLQLKRDAAVQSNNLRREFAMDPEGFADAWDSWSSGVTAEFRETSPAFAVQIGGYLDSIGTNNYNTLADNNAARQREQLSTEGLTAVQESVAANTDLLLNDPNGEDYTSAVASLAQDVGGLVEQGLISSASAARLSVSASQDLTEAFVRGKFSGRMADGDFEGASSLVQSLRKGKYFQNNNVGFALANELSGSLKSAGGAGTDRSGRLLKVLDIEHDAIAAGRPRALSDQQLTKLVTQISNYAKPEDALEAQNKLTSILYQQEFKKHLASASLPELESLSAGLTDARFNLSPTMSTHLDELVENRMNVVASAKINNNPALLTEQMAPIAAENPEELLGFISQQREQMYKVTGVPPEHQPTYGPKERKVFEDEFSQAITTGNIERATRLINNYTLPDLDNPTGLLHSVAQLSEQGGLFYGAVTLNAMGALPEATRLVQLAGAGKSANLDALNAIDGVIYDRSFTAQRMANGDFGGGVLQGINNISMGNPSIRGSLIATALDTFEGALLELQDEDLARAEVARLFEPLSKGVVFSNGAQLSSMYVKDESTVSQVNSLLNNPERLGIPAGASTVTQHLIPRPLPGGAIGLYDPRSGAFLANPKNLSEMFEVVPKLPSAAPEPEEQEGFLESIGNGVVEALENFHSFVSGGIRKDSLEFAASHVGANPELASAVFVSASQVGAQGAGSRTGDVLLNPEWSADLAQVIKDEIDITDTDKQPLYVAKVLKIASETFPNSREKQLAMYWLGPEGTEDLVSTYGGDWLDFVDPETDAFISRAMEAFNAK